MRDIAHEGKLPLAPEDGLGGACFQSGGDDFEARGFPCGGFRIKGMVAAEQFPVAERRDLRDGDKHMEMIGHERIGENADAAEVGGFPKLFAKDLLGGVIKDALVKIAQGGDVTSIAKDLDSQVEAILNK